MDYSHASWRLLEITRYWKSSTKIYKPNPFQPSFAFHIETILLICTANQVTRFYMKCNTGLKLVNTFNTNVSTRQKPAKPIQIISINPFSANFTKWSNTLKQFVGNLATNCLSVFDHFVGLAFKGLSILLY